jgi:hypothetical protein
MPKGKKTYQFIAGLFIFAFYLAFILVQVLFNFDTHSGSQPGFYSIFPAANSHQAIHQLPVPRDSRCSFRLNKRFHPESIPTLQVFSTTCPLIYLPIEDAFAYKLEFTPTPVLLRQALRGPPAVA